VGLMCCFGGCTSLKYQALCVLESRNKGDVWGLWIWAYWTMDFIGVVCHLAGGKQPWVYLEAIFGTI
jgi:hypothetical protein